MSRNFLLKMTSFSILLYADMSTLSIAATTKQEPAKFCKPPTKQPESGCTEQNHPTPNSNLSSITCAIHQVIINDRTLRDEIECLRDDQQSKQTMFDSSLIGLSTATVAAAFFRGSRDLMGGLGIATGGLEQYRGYYNNKKRVHDYNISIAAARCVSSQAESLQSVDPQKEYWSRMRRLKKWIYYVETARDALPPGAAGDSGRAAAAQAISAAESAFAALQTEALAILDAPSTIDQAHDAIKNHLDAIRERTEPTSTGVTSALNDAIVAVSKVESATATAKDQLVSAMVAGSKAAMDANTAQPKKAPAIVNLVQQPENDPLTLNEAQTPPLAPAPAPVTVTSSNPDEPSAKLQVNVTYVNKLNDVTEEVLKMMPAKRVTGIISNVQACVVAVR